jgi:aspartyl-tRNA(Asn)/glutamyl-tRNA(Gln) amidotransferase subunit A
MGLSRDIRSVRVGVPRQLKGGRLAGEVRDAFGAALDTLRGVGLELHEIDLPCLDDGPTIQRPILFSEAAAYHQKLLRAAPEDYSTRMREQLILGLSVPAVDYLQAQRLRRVFTRQLTAAFQEVDLLASPASAVEATPSDQHSVIIDGQVLEDVTPLTRLTNPFNVAGLPAVSLPCGFSRSGLPLGLQIVGPHFAEGLVLAAAHRYEQVTPWHKRRPGLRPGGAAP